MIINLENIYDVSFNDGTFHFTSNCIKFIPEIISYNKSHYRYFIFYNCTFTVTHANTISWIDMGNRFFYKYEVFYEKKFTDKSEDGVRSKFLSYLRDEKINILL